MKQINQIGLLILTILILIPSVLSLEDYYFNDSLGTPMNDNGIIVSSTSLDKSLELLQTANAEGATQVGTAQSIYEVKKEFLLQQSDDALSIIVALFKLIVDAVVLLIYFIEMRLILYVMVELLPSFFTKMLESLANFIILKRGKR